ncbi:MAG: hypothetical protein PWP16_448 [Eubacteriaceae bacterium]|jgi:hypothetical protein|nr:hypothetical protein [Eubacteriaceae bacterium]
MYAQRWVATAKNHDLIEIIGTYKEGEKIIAALEEKNRLSGFDTKGFYEIVIVSDDGVKKADAVEEKEYDELDEMMSNEEDTDYLYQD